jgi:hypothetical protein
MAKSIDRCVCGRDVTSPRLKVCSFCWSVLQYEILQSFAKDGEDLVVDRMLEIIKNDPDVVRLYKCQRCKAWLEEDDLEGHDEDCDIGGLELDDLSEDSWALVEKAENYEADKASGDLKYYDYRAEDVDF